MDDMKPTPRPANSGFEFNNPTIISLLYLASFITGITAIVGVVLAFVWRDEPKADWEISHYQYLINTFWIGLLGSIIGFLLTIVLIGFPIAITLWVSLVPFYDGINLAALERFSLDNFNTVIFQTSFTSAILNTFILALSTATLVAGFTTLAAWLAVRRALNRAKYTTPVPGHAWSTPSRSCTTFIALAAVRGALRNTTSEWNASGFVPKPFGAPVTIARSWRCDRTHPEYLWRSWSG